MFLGQTAAAALAGARPDSARADDAKAAATAAPPWYRRTLRWGQTNITEIDPAGYDIGWWRRHWKRTRVQGVIVNAGGIVAYYPSKYPLHSRPAALGDRDLFGELAKAAHDDGLAVLARMDSNRTHEAFYKAHPDWFAVDASGKPYRAGELYVTCVNSPYYAEYIPGVLREVIERTHPEGITDNSWSGLGRESICHCANCTKKFKERTGKGIPRAPDWDDAVYREWVQWNYARRLEIWDLNNRATRAAGGPDCLWVGMNSGSISGQCRSFRDYQEICRRAEIILLDHQAVRRFVERGGHLVATGQTSLYDQWGRPRADLALGDLLGATVASGRRPSIEADRRRAGETLHSYLRLAPELRAGVYGPKAGTEPAVAGKRHPALEGFEETDILPFGGSLGGVRAAGGTQVLATFVPPFPTYPPETSWMREPRTNEPGLVVHTGRHGSRVAYLPADLDRRYARDGLPDHGTLLANLVRWASGDTLPLTVHGPGVVDCHLYRQPNRLILHLVNLTSAGAWRGPVDELVPVGPMRIEVRIPEGVRVSRMRLLASRQEPSFRLEKGAAVVQLPSLLDHEVIVWE
jgi:hypothetical protein